MERKPTWRSKDVWSIALSAFFADLGYQSVLVAFPIFLVIYLHKPVWEYGLAMSLSYGGGAVFSFMGSKIGDRFGHRKTAIIGNSFIPLLSLSALANNPVWAISLLTLGWLARNFRSPSRRVMLSDADKSEEFRARTFGFLHALDIGGAALAAMLVLIAFERGATYRIIFLATALPLAASTLILFRPNTGNKENSPNSMKNIDIHPGMILLQACGPLGSSRGRGEIGIRTRFRS